MRENSWLSYTDEDDKNVEVLAGEYKEFLSKCKTERECTEYFTKEAEACGYQELIEPIAQSTISTPASAAIRYVAIPFPVVSCV